MMKYPDWFKMETGFRFYDPDGYLFVILGHVDYTGHSPVGSVYINIPGNGIDESIYNAKTRKYLIASMVYKNSFSLVNLYDSDYIQAWWDLITPCED